MADGQNSTAGAGADSTSSNGGQGATTAGAAGNADASKAAGDKSFLGENPQAAKTVEDDKSQGADGAKKDVQPPVDIELKWPEGFKADPKFETGFKALGKELGINSASAQKLAEFYVSTQKAMAEQQKQAEAQTFSQRREQWFQSLQSDQEIGGKNFEASQVAAAKALERFGQGLDVKGFLKSNNIENSPELMRLLVRVGKSISEDSVAGATSGAPSLTPQQQQEAVHRAHFPLSFKE